MQRILVTCAHPDDETLGLGGTLVNLSSKKSEIFVLIFTDGESDRGVGSKEIKKRREQAKKASKILGVKKIKFLNYRDQNLDQIPVSKLAKNVEKIIQEWKPEIVFSHFWGDLNHDHQMVFNGTSIAIRPLPGSTIKKFLCFETPSSTELSFKNEIFHPNFFVKISKKTLNKKILALEQYQGELRPFPHPRSKEAIVTKAAHWGNQNSLEFAEAFMIVREIQT